MFDPVGGFDRMIDQFLAYLDTAYRIKDPKVASARRSLLASAGQLALDPLFEAVPRYETWLHGLEGLIEDKEKTLPNFTPAQRTAFVELALSGLFDRDRKQPGYVGAYRPYEHQIEMLRRGTADGTPGIVASGTGSGKTESFLLPILAHLAKEAASWPAPSAPYDDDWLNAGNSFRLHRRNEGPGRRQAVRALILYPLNALVEDQMVRLRKALDSPDARSVMDRHFNGNRIFFGRYTGKTPVTGFHMHPRMSNDPAWKKRSQNSRAELKKQLQRIRAVQQRLVQDGNDPELRYVFPTTDGGELVSRWDMQASPPDILVTNQSILNAMLVREVDDPILRQTKDWLESDPEARFYLVLDELHLIRGSAGAEMAGLIRILIEKLGLTTPANAHKLRILASSASLPVDDANAPTSVKYLMDMFGPGGTAGAADQHKTWKDSVVPGRPVQVEIPDEMPSADSLRDLSNALASFDRDGRPEALLSKFVSAARSIPGNEIRPEKEALEQATAVAARMIDFALQKVGAPNGKSPRGTLEISEKLYGKGDADIARGLLALRAIPDLPSTVLPQAWRPSQDVVTRLPGFRMHCFVRNVEGLFAAVFVDADGQLAWGDPGIERGQDHEEVDSSGITRRRLFELLYCEACGELFVGGKRGDASKAGGKRISLLPAPQDLERLPESAASIRFEDASFEEFALFWPGRTAPETEIKPGSPYRWLQSFLNPSTGVVQEDEDVGFVPGYLLDWNGRTDFHNRSSSDDGTAVPYCCASCGTDYSGRFRAANSAKRDGRKSPIRSFRTGFAKTSQLLATELVASLKAQGGDGKLVAFSDSREDAANLAIDVEVQHQRDLRREILIGAATHIAANQTFTEDDEKEMAAISKKMMDMLMGGEGNGVTDLAIRLERLKKLKDAHGHPVSVPLESLFEFMRGQTAESVRPILSELLSLGSTPVEGVDTWLSRIRGRPWYWFFEKLPDGQYRWKTDETEQNLALLKRAKDRINDEQPPEATDLLFSKTYFALEETGLGWPSFYGQEAYTPEKSRNDAWLRIFSDFYRITPNQFQEDASTVWSDAQSMRGRGDNKLARLLDRIFGPRAADECTAFLATLRNDLKQDRGDGSIDITRLFFRTSSADTRTLRCKKCARVHLHRGFGRCTRCGEDLAESEAQTAGQISQTNFLGRRVMRSIQQGESPFRLKCEELTGQTRDPAERLQQFKGVFVREDGENDETFAARKLFDTADLLSVTTTMEVGVDIGSLQAVYQGNMPPQRFNYQQRVGRAGRRGQAFSAVLTVCRSKSHDIHYFHHPIEITGSAPPPPFITTGLIDIPSRLLRKFWLVEAFRILREQHSAAWAGDQMIPGDIHGEFLYCDEYFRPGASWRDELRAALQATLPERTSFVNILASAAACDAEELRTAVSVENVILEIDGLETEYGSLQIGIASALAERGLFPVFGMPTRSRDLYLGLEKKNDEAEWDTIDRDQDMAIFDFAPGNVRTREKLRHKCVGFTGTLKAPDAFKDDLDFPLAPFNSWLKEGFFLRFCSVCGTWSKNAAVAAECSACGSTLEDEPQQCLTPASYRTDFRPTDESVQAKVGQRIVLASLGKPDDEKTDRNLEVKFAERSEIFVVNPGFREDLGFSGFEVQTAFDNHALRIGWFKNKPVLRLSDQAISSEVLRDDVENRFRSDTASSKGWLVSPKITNSLQVGPGRVNENLRLTDMDVGLSLGRRSPDKTSVRAAAISATEILIQRAALDLDIAPEEFDSLAPNTVQNRAGAVLPYLQIADALPNGSGFCRRLLSNSSLPLSRLIDSILDETTAWPRSMLSVDGHVGKCGASCYRCLQRYNNRNFHGLLDWRLGLSYLRAMADADHQCGLDGNWSSFFELSDWPRTAQALAMQTSTFIPGNVVSHVNGRPDIPTFSLSDGGGTVAVVVHPLWNRSRCLDLLHVGMNAVVIDTFELARRPLQAIQRARGAT
ncbi:DEAD/DEAH box helicase [Asticcacaulis sp.]|uniref:DEAD/DEAH box helicase n=1 Tax=Asticcacaulis sp. TaxID=1872648 RepID=UPI003F7CA44F